MAHLLPQGVPQKPVAAALARSAEEEEHPEPLAPEVEKTPDFPALSEEVPPAGTESPVPASHSPPGCSQALLDLEQNINMSKAVREIQASEQMPPALEHRDLEQSMAANYKQRLQHEGKKSNLYPGTALAAPPAPLQAPWEHTPPGNSRRQKGGQYCHRKTEERGLGWQAWAFPLRSGERLKAI